MAGRSALVIFHGGHETLMQVLAAGVPSLIIPSNPDQLLVAKQVQRIGAGRCLKNPRHLAPMDFNPLKGISPTQIRHAIETVLDDTTCKTNCLAIKRQIEEYLISKPYLQWIEK